MYSVKVLLACLVILPPIPAAAQPGLPQSSAMRQLSGAAALTLGGEDLPGIGLTQAVPYNPKDNPLQGRVPDVTVDLKSIFNKHWKTADSYTSNGKKTYLSAHFDFKGEVYLSVLPPGWSKPLLYRFGAGMAGAWRVGEDVYRLKLDVSIFRNRTNNWIVITKDGDEKPIYKKRIRELLAVAYHAGRTTHIGNIPYQLYFSYATKGDKDPYRMAPRKFGIVLSYNTGDDKDHQYYNYIIDYDETKDGKTGYYLLYNGHKTAFRTRPNTTILEIYDLSRKQTSIRAPRPDERSYYTDEDYDVTP
ncbi:hypothetical protein ACFL2T_07230 [Elusimicrobiota bacterium]